MRQDEVHGDDPRPGPDLELMPPRGRTRLVGASALVVAAGVIAAVLVAARPGSVVGPAAPTVPVVDRGTPLRDGDRVAASGVVVSVPGRPVRFCSPVPHAASGTSGQGQPPLFCDYGVDVTGVELTALQDRREENGAIDGAAELHGVLSGGVVAVDRQGPPHYPPPSLPVISPPCATPVGGWARDEGVRAQAASNYKFAHPGEVVSIAVSRPTAGVALVLVLTAGDPEPVRAALSTTYRADQLCVVTSRVSRAEIDAAQRDPALALTAATGVDLHGESLSAGGQPIVTADATLLTPELAAAVARQPEGLLVIDAWLQREQP